VEKWKSKNRIPTFPPPRQPAAQGKNQAVYTNLLTRPLESALSHSRPDRTSPPHPNRPSLLPLHHRSRSAACIPRPSIARSRSDRTPPYSSALHRPQSSQTSPHTTRLAPAAQEQRRTLYPTPAPAAHFPRLHCRPSPVPCAERISPWHLSHSDHSARNYSRKSSLLDRHW